MPENDLLYSQLCRLGMDAPAARVYSCLVRTGPRSIRELAFELQAEPAAVAAAVAALAALDLAAPPVAPDGEVEPLDPGVATKQLQAQREAELTTAVNVTRRRYEGYRRAVATPAGPEAVEIIAGDRLQEAVDELEQSAIERVRSLDAPPYGSPELANPIEVANLRRSVRYQVVYTRSSVEDADFYRANIAPCIAAGEESRVISSVPAKVMVVDDRAAVVLLTVAETDRNRSGLLVRRCSLLPALIALFDGYWERAGSLSGPEVPVAGLRPLERELLPLLATGATDEVAARSLGVSRRSITRSMERLMQLTDSASRFELAVKAHRAGWL
ncbi:transcriptional regulator TrmB [Amycolatopsis sp. PS_44_ISF1]|uniref:transcriptional regulator TrmB n=1 Tax=Amycolatopsis sp. PS_44_ISF1 TaxID=2974917 RepID=UPI0028DFA395|nr:transcriptional regulator TrmB [Amycolatopsis sp. PS_44_ISF1]MDT8913033.1 transcriptional regulator TrmB [Amycolatopsis sp. PS_44_ISF1]